MLFVNFLCLFFLMVLVASHTISKSIDRSYLLDDAVDSVDDHQPQKHPRRDKDNKRHLHWRQKSSVLKEIHESKSTTRIVKEVNNATINVKQNEMEKAVPKEKKATISDKASVASLGKYVKITTKLISTSKGAEKVRSKEKKKKYKSKHGHRTRARSNSDKLPDKHRRDLPVTKPASSYYTAEGYHHTDRTLSHYYKMLAEMSTKLDKLMRLYSNSYGQDPNRAFTLPSLQALKQSSDRFTDSFHNRVLAPDFEGTDKLESLLSEVKFRAIEMNGKQTPALTNTVVTTSFTADPMLLHYDPPHAKVMRMDFKEAAPKLAPRTRGFIEQPVMTTVKSLKEGNYNDDDASYFVVLPVGTRRDRAASDHSTTAGTTVGEQIQKKLKDIFSKVKSIGSDKEHKICNTTRWVHTTKSSLKKPALRTVASTKSEAVTLKVKVKQFHPNETTLRPTNKVLVYTKLPRGKHRKVNLHSTKKSKHKKIRKKPTHHTSTTPMTVVTEDNDYAVLSLMEQMLYRDERPNIAQLLSTAITPFKRHNRRAVHDVETGSITNSLEDIPSNYDNPSTDTPIDDTSYEGLTKKISYNDFVDGYRHYLKFEKDMGHSNFSNMVRYQAHRHHDVDEIGKFILDKLPQLPTQQRNKRDFFDYDDEDQDISTKSEESWFKKHFYYLADRSVPPRKFHSYQLVPLKSPLAARDHTLDEPNKLMKKKLKSKTARVESQSADGEKIDDLDELARMLKRSSSATTSLVSDTASTPPPRLFNKMFCGVKNKSPRKHTVKKHSKRPVEEPRLTRIRRHDLDKKRMSKSNVQREEAEFTKSTEPSNLFDQVASEEQKTKEKRDRIESTNAAADKTIEGKDKKKLGFVNVELVPATTAGTLKKVKEGGRFAKFMHSFRLRMKKPEKRQRRQVTRKQRCGLFGKLKQMFDGKPKTHTEEHFLKNSDIVTRKISVYNPVKYGTNLNEIKYEIPGISDYIRNTDYPDLTTAGQIISSPDLVDFWVTKEPLKALEPTFSHVQQLFEERRDNKKQKSNAEKIDQIRKELENIEAKTNSPSDWTYDPTGKALKDFEDAIEKINTGAITTVQSKHTSPQSTNINDDTLAKKNNAIYRQQAALDTSATGVMNYITKKPYAKLNDFSLKPQYKDRVSSVPGVPNFVKENYFNSPKSTINDDFNDLIIWNSDILHSDSVLPTMPPVKAISIKDEFAEFLKGNQLYAEHTFSKKVQIADKNQKDRPKVSGGKKMRSIKYKGRNAKDMWNFRRDLMYDNIAKRLDALLNRTRSTERYDRMSTENYNKVMNYETNLKESLTDTTTLPYEKDIDYLRNALKITLSPEVRSFTLYKKNKSKMTLPEHFHTTPLPMKHKDFDDFLKQNYLDVESVTASESEGTRTIVCPILTHTEDPYNTSNSKSSENHVDNSHQISEEILRRIYGFEDSIQKSLKRKIKHQRKPSREEGDLHPNLLIGIQNLGEEGTVDDYDDQTEVPQFIPESAFPYHEKDKESTEPDSKDDDAPDQQQEQIRHQEQKKENIATVKKPGIINKFNYSRNSKHNKLLFGMEEELPNQTVLDPTELKSKPTRPPKRIIIKGHSYKYDIVLGDGRMLFERDRPGGANASADPEDPTQDGRERGKDQLNILKAKEPDQERRKGKEDIASSFGSPATDNGMVPVKGTYNFLNSLLRQQTLGAVDPELLRPAGSLDFHNYVDAGVKLAQELKDKLQRKQNEKRKGKREAEESYTAKNVAEIEVIVDLIKNPEAFEELSRSLHPLNTSSEVVNKEVKPANSIQVHIGVPRYDTECHSAKRSLQNIKKVFVAKLCTPVDLEYQVKSYVIPTSTAIPTGVYLLLDNDGSDGNFVLKPLFHNIDVAVVKSRDINPDLKDYSTEKITTTQTLSKLNKVTLTKDFVASVNKHLMQLCELLSANDTHNVHTRAANQEKPRRSLSWKKLKKYFRGEHVCDCKCKANSVMCNSCAATDKVMTDLIYQIDNLIRFMNDHCTEIQTFFYNNPSGGRKLKDSVKLLDRNLQNYYKRVKGTCKGKSCDGFKLLDKRFFYSTPKYKYTDLLNYFPYGINSPIMDETELTEAPVGDVFSEKNLNVIGESDKFKTDDSNKKTRLKTVYSLDNVNVNIICKDNNMTTAKVAPKRLDIGQVAPYTKPILVRVENKVKKGIRNFNKYNKREVGQIDSPLNADSSGSFWNDYFNKINESALIFVATGMIPDTGTSKVNNESIETTVENIHFPIEKTSHLTTLHGTNDGLQTRSATLSYGSVINTEALSTDKPLQEDLNELIKLLDDVYVKDFNDITMNVNTTTKKPVDTTKTTSKNGTSHKDIKVKSKSKSTGKETADTDTTTESTLTDSTLTDSILLNYTTPYIFSNTTLQIQVVEPNISERPTENWRSSTTEFKNLFPYLKKFKNATLGWFNYDKSKVSDVDDSAPVTHEKDQLVRVMKVLGIKNKKEAYTTNHAKSQVTTETNPTILIFNDDDEPFVRSYSKDSPTPAIDNSSDIDVLDINSTVDSFKNLLLSLLKYESQKLAKEWKRYAGRNHNAKSVDGEPKKDPEDDVMLVTVEAMNKTVDYITDQESRGDKARQKKGTEKQKEQGNQKEQDKQKIKNEIQEAIEIAKEAQEEKEIEKEIQNEKLLIKYKEKEIAKEKRKNEGFKEKLRKLKEKRKKLAQLKNNNECKLKPKEKGKALTQKQHNACKDNAKHGKQQLYNVKCKEERIKEGNLIPKPISTNVEPEKKFSTCYTVTEKTIKLDETSQTKVVSIFEPLKKLMLPAPLPGKEGFINKILNRLNVSWGTPFMKKEETTQPSKIWRLTEATEAVPVAFNDYYDSDAIMSVSLITGDKGEMATERRSIVEPMDPLKSDDGSVQPRRLCDLQDTFSYALTCLQQDKKWFQDYAKRIPCHRYMDTPKMFCIEPGKRDRGKIAVSEAPKRKLRWLKRNKRALYVEEIEDPLKVDDATDEELLDGNTHSLRDDLMTNDGFERMYKDEFGIYRIETRKKRSSVNTEAVIQGLKDLAPIKVPKNVIYAMPRDSVSISCALDAAKGPIDWALNDGPIPENAVATGTRLAIQDVKTENSGNYTCFQVFRSGTLSAGRRERWTQLTVVRLPVFRIVTFLLYRCRPPCTADTNHSSLASVFVDVAPARRAARCGVECARNMYCSLARLIADNAATIATVPVIVSWKVRNTTLTPLVRQKIFVTQTSNIPESNPLRTHAKWTSGEMDVKMYCPAGFYLVPDMKLCVTNPKRHLPVTPGRLRRYDWWHPSYRYVVACVVVGAVCACGANALARGEGAAEGGRGNRVTTMPCVEESGRRRISPSRVILPRLFRHASSRISQETKLDLKKLRMPPPLPPIDFDP